MDLGELAEGHHIIARGIDFGRQVDVHRWEQEMQRDLEERIAEEMRAEAEGGNVGGSFQAFGRRTLTKGEQEIVGTRDLESELHYEFVPGLRRDEGFDWYWMLQTFDDVGTSYSDSNGGTRGPATSGPATHATRALRRVDSRFCHSSADRL